VYVHTCIVCYPCGVTINDDDEKAKTTIYRPSSAFKGLLGARAEMTSRPLHPSIVHPSLSPDAKIASDLYGIMAVPYHRHACRSTKTHVDYKSETLQNRCSTPVLLANETEFIHWKCAGFYSVHSTGDIDTRIWRIYDHVTASWGSSKVTAQSDTRTNAAKRVTTYIAIVFMPPPAHVGERGNIKSGCDVCGSVCLSVILCVMTLVYVVSPQWLQLETSNFARGGLRPPDNPLPSLPPLFLSKVR